jgi:hypothetical protein
LDQAVLDAKYFLHNYFETSKKRANQITNQNIQKMFDQVKKGFREQWLEEKIHIASTVWVEKGGRPNGKEAFKAEFEQKGMELLRECLIFLDVQISLNFPGSKNYIVAIKQFQEECNYKSGRQFHFKGCLDWIDYKECSDSLAAKEQEMKETHERLLRNKEDQERKRKEKEEANKEYERLKSDAGKPEIKNQDNIPKEKEIKKAVNKRKTAIENNKKKPIQVIMVASGNKTKKFTSPSGDSTEEEDESNSSADTNEADNEESEESEEGSSGDSAFPEDPNENDETEDDSLGSDCRILCSCCFLSQILL